MAAHNRALEIVLVGDNGVGKTSIVRRYFKNEFSTEPSRTTGDLNDTHRKDVTVEGKTVSFVVTDTAGQEFFRHMTASYYQDKHAVLLVFDLTNQQSFNNVKEGWWPDIQKYDDKGMEVLLVGNKVDLADRRAVQTADAERFARDVGFVGYVETSAAQNTRVEEAFNQLMDRLIARHRPDIHRKKKCILS